MTDNRTNEPTEAQARAVRKLDNVQAILAGAQASVTDAVRELSLVSAALVAAQGAVPQAESDDFPTPGKRLTSEFRADIVEAARDRIQAVWADVPEGVDALTLAQNIVAAQEFFWLSLHFPVLPSSDVDEDKLAEVIEQHVLGEPNGGTSSWAWVNCSCGHRVEVSGVTREHVVALGRKHQARAVAEWLKGQGR